MKVGVIVFPGSNCDRDIAVAFERAGAEVDMVWHKEAGLPDNVDLVAVPGGFSFGDYLRCGAIAAHSPVLRDVVAFAERGGYVLGVCNGFQILVEAGLLPGVLMRNAGLRFVCRDIPLKVSAKSVFTEGYALGQEVVFPVAHHDGNYFASPELRKQLAEEDRVAFTYADNPNGSMADIAGVLSENRRILGLMPHPERAADPDLGLSDGLPLFKTLTSALVAA